MVPLNDIFTHCFIPFHSAPMGVSSILPPVSAAVWDRESDERRRRQQAQQQQQQQALVTASRAAPPYGHRKGWLPRSQEVSSSTRIMFFIYYCIAVIMYAIDLVYSKKDNMLKVLMHLHY